MTTRHPAGPTTLALLAILLASPHALAQSRPVPLRVTLQIGLTLPSSPTASQSERAAEQEGGRRVLYRLAQGECGILKEVFAGECRLLGLNVTSGSQQRPNGLGQVLEVNILSGTATYEIGAEPGQKL